MLHLIDRLAGWWFDWRSDQAIKNADPELKEFNLQRLDATPGGMQLMAIAPAVAIIADQAAELLDVNNAKNYIQFDMMPRLDRGLRPVRVTVQWANGGPPAEKAARLEKQLEELKSQKEGVTP